MKSEQQLPHPAASTSLYYQYQAAVNLLSQTNIRRTATARFFIMMASALIGLLAVVHRPGVDTETQFWIINIVAWSSIFLNFVWFMVIRSLRYLAMVQRTLLREMEELLPFAFITKQEQIMGQSSGWLNTGKIEQYVSLAMMVPAALFLLITNLETTFKL